MRYRPRRDARHSSRIARARAQRWEAWPITHRPDIYNGMAGFVLLKNEPLRGDRSKFTRFGGTVEGVVSASRRSFQRACTIHNDLAQPIWSNKFMGIRATDAYALQPLHEREQLIVLFQARQV